MPVKLSSLQGTIIHKKNRFVKGFFSPFSAIPRHNSVDNPCIKSGGLSVVDGKGAAPQNPVPRHVPPVEKSVDNLFFRRRFFSFFAGQSARPYGKIDSSRKTVQKGEID
jgi:hypothetical protein